MFNIMGVRGKPKEPVRRRRHCKPWKSYLISSIPKFLRALFLHHEHCATLHHGHRSTAQSTTFLTMNRPQRYNAKARSSVAGGSHKKGKAKKTHSEDPPAVEGQADTNADILEHKAEEDKERDRRERMKREVRLLCLSVLEYGCNIRPCGISSCWNNRRAKLRVRSGNVSTSISYVFRGTCGLLYCNYNHSTG